MAHPKAFGGQEDRINSSSERERKELIGWRLEP